MDIPSIESSRRSSADVVHEFPLKTNAYLLHNPVLTATALMWRPLPCHNSKFLRRTMQITPALKPMSSLSFSMSSNSASHVLGESRGLTDSTSSSGGGGADAHIEEGVIFNPATAKFEIKVYYPAAKVVEIVIYKIATTDTTRTEREPCQRCPLRRSPSRRDSAISSNPTATTTVSSAEQSYSASKRSSASVEELSGCWEGEVEVPVGRTYFSIVLDGVEEVLNPYIAIGLHFSRANHYLERPPEAVRELSLRNYDIHHRREDGEVIPDGELREVEQETTAVLRAHPYLVRPGVPRGALVEDFVESTRLGRVERIVLYLPYSYLSRKCDPSRTYPALYLQHGFGGSETVWGECGKIQHILDNMIADKRCVEMVVVMSNGMLSEYQDSNNHKTNWANKDTNLSPLIPQFDQSYYCEMLARDVVPYVQGKYRVKRSRDARAIAGFSMGSCQASWLGLNPEVKLFSYIGLLSGFVQCEYLGFILGGNDRHLLRLLQMQRQRREFAKHMHLKKQEEEEKENDKTTPTVPPHAAGRDPIAALSPALDVRRYLREELKIKLVYRCIGDHDVFFSYFAEDDEFLRKLGIFPEEEDLFIRRVYEGYSHNAAATRAMVTNFLSLLFRDEETRK